MIILDTHTLLWFLTDSDKLPEDLKNIFPKKKRFNCTKTSVRKKIAGRRQTLMVINKHIEFLF